ncbi:MAG: hypothetical protein K8S54_01280 [Spirochaetia bacterium]|nr:hypothetical protein [Spirochaetia bacterium]
MLEEVSQLIDKRETKGSLDKAIEILERLKTEHPEKDIIRGKLSSAYFYKGLFSVEGSREREDAFDHGVKYGQEAITLNPRAIYGNFWCASNLGYLGMCRGALASLASIDPFKKSMEVVLRENENFYFAGPHRALGRLMHQAPGWPISIGNKNKAAEHLEKAVQIAPNFFNNRLYLAEILMDLGKKEKALEHLNWCKATPLNPGHEIEDGVYKESAEKLLKRIS